MSESFEREYAVLGFSTEAKTFMGEFGDYAFEAETKASLGIHTSGNFTRISVNYRTGYLKFDKHEGKLHYGMIILVMGNASTVTYSDVKAINKGVGRLRQKLSEITAYYIEKYHDRDAFQTVYGLWKSGKEIPFTDLSAEFRNLLSKAFPTVEGEVIA